MNKYGPEISKNLCKKEHNLHVINTTANFKKKPLQKGCQSAQRKKLKGQPLGKGLYRLHQDQNVFCVLKIKAAKCCCVGSGRKSVVDVGRVGKGLVSTWV